MQVHCAQPEVAREAGKECFVNEWTIHTPDMGREPDKYQLLRYKERRWCDIHGMYEFVFECVDNTNV